jgi:hypothetical protein
VRNHPSEMIVRPPLALTPWADREAGRRSGCRIFGLGRRVMTERPDEEVVELFRQHLKFLRERERELGWSGGLLRHSLMA